MSRARNSTESTAWQSHIDAALREVAATAEPAAALILAPAAGLRSPVAVLAGAFDPPTSAHMALARAALRAGARTVLFSIALRTINKEDRAHADLALRLEMLRACARRRSRLGIVVCNRGLYLEQAQALEPLGVHRPRFVIGFDKLPQIFDPRYYQDREACLRKLFDAASFLVAPRDAAEPADVTTFMLQPEQLLYAAGVASLRLTADEERAMAEISSTRIRERIASGGDWEGLVPREVRGVIRRSGAYLDSARRG